MDELDWILNGLKIKWGNSLRLNTGGNCIQYGWSKKGL